MQEQSLLETGYGVNCRGLACNGSSRVLLDDLLPAYVSHARLSRRFLEASLVSLGGSGSGPWFSCCVGFPRGALALAPARLPWCGASWRVGVAVAGDGHLVPVVRPVWPVSSPLGVVRFCSCWSGPPGPLVWGSLVRGRCLCQGRARSCAVRARSVLVVFGWRSLTALLAPRRGFASCVLWRLGLVPSAGALWLPWLGCSLAPGPGVRCSPPWWARVGGPLGSAGCGLLFSRAFAFVLGCPCPGPGSPLALVLALTVLL